LIKFFNILRYALNKHADGFAVGPKRGRIRKPAEAAERKSLKAELLTEKSEKVKTKGE
jgi:hypothetical protein